jgi:hypothetical protein
MHNEPHPVRPQRGCNGEPAMLKMERSRFLSPRDDFATLKWPPFDHYIWPHRVREGIVE